MENAGKGKEEGSIREGRKRKNIIYRECRTEVGVKRTFSFSLRENNFHKFVKIACENVRKLRKV
jgi:hypothetical protein